MEKNSNENSTNTKNEFSETETLSIDCLSKELAHLKEKYIGLRREVFLLRTKNQALLKENARLRKICALTPEHSPSQIEELFEKIDFRSHPQVKQILISFCQQTGIENLSDFQNQKADDILKHKGIGETGVAALCVICSNYGIDLQPSAKLKSNRYFSKKFQSFSRNLEFFN